LGDDASRVQTYILGRKIIHKSSVGDDEPFDGGGSIGGFSLGVHTCFTEMGKTRDSCPTWYTVVYTPHSSQISVGIHRFHSAFFKHA
jgi:hypothetical protein